MPAGMLPQLQTNNGTFFGRYWTETSLLRRYVASDRDLSILSFGCSTGEELLLLRQLFPVARLHGCEHDWANLMAARALLGASALIFDSTAEALARHGPYDLIVCNSVLLSHTVAGPDGPRGIDPSLWCDMVTLLDGVLKPGGILQLINSNIPFRLHPLATGYTSLRTPLILGPNHVDMFDLDGRRLCRGVPGFGFSPVPPPHIGDDGWQALRPEDFTDVHFQKHGGTPAAPILHQRLPNMAGGAARASGQASFRPALPEADAPTTLVDLDLAWESVGVEGVRVTRTARRRWFDGGHGDPSISVTEMHGPLASAFFESLISRPSTRLTLAALDARPMIHSPIF